VADGKPWFRVKRHGYGAGPPCSWEGWAVVALYVVLLLGSAVLHGKDHPRLVGAFVVVMTLAVMLVARWKSDAPWRWRDGEED